MAVSASTNCIADVTTVSTNGPNSATQALAITASGQIMDYQGNVSIVLVKLQETAQLLAAVIGDTDASDSTNLTKLEGVYNALAGSTY